VEPETKNDCADEGQQQISVMVRTVSSQSGVSCESGIGTLNWWLAMSTEAEESPLLEAATKQWLVKTQQTEKA
jgi:hypothetical protein